jgi:PqqD family protein of HPr-rel-A system
MGDLSMDLRPPTRSPDVALQRVGQEAILHDRRNGRAHVINESAARIWDLCDGRASLDEIAVALAASYNIEASVVRADVGQIVAKFRELQVLEA